MSSISMYALRTLIGHDLLEPFILTSHHLVQTLLIHHNSPIRPSRRLPENLQNPLRISRSFPSRILNSKVTPRHNLLRPLLRHIPQPPLPKIALVVIMFQDLIHLHLRPVRRHHQRNRRASTRNHSREADQREKRIQEQVRQFVVFGTLAFLLLLHGVEFVGVGEEALEAGELGGEEDGGGLKGFVHEVEPVGEVLEGFDVDVGLVEDGLGEVAVGGFHVFAAADELDGE